MASDEAAVTTTTAVTAIAIVAAKGIPTFLMLSDKFPRLLCAHNVITRCETIRQKLHLELGIQPFLQLANLYS